MEAGKLDANRDFGTPRKAVDFMNGSFGAPPTIPMPTFPDAALGAVVIAQPHERVVARVGIYYGDLAARTLRGSGGVFAVSSAVWRWRFVGDAPLGYVGLGAWHHSGVFTNTNPTGMVPQRGGRDQGVYVIGGDRIAYLSSDARALGWLARAGIVPSHDVPVSAFAGVGLLLRSLGDPWRYTAGIGASLVRLPAEFNKIPADASEVAVEAFVKLPVHGSVALQPDVQYVVSPSGIFPDALAVALRLLVWL
ncbi:MAG: carbohydrate porin [Myxococcales bacterium]